MRNKVAVGGRDTTLLLPKQLVTKNSNVSTRQAQQADELWAPTCLDRAHSAKGHGGLVLLALELYC